MAFNKDSSPRVQAAQGRGKGPLTRNSPCPMHPWHPIKYCPDVKAKVLELKAEREAAEDSVGEEE